MNNIEVVPDASYWAKYENLPQDSWFKEQSNGRGLYKKCIESCVLSYHKFRELDLNDQDNLRKSLGYL